MRITNPRKIASKLRTEYRALLCRRRSIRQQRARAEKDARRATVRLWDALRTRTLAVEKLGSLIGREQELIREGIRLGDILNTVDGRPLPARGRPRRRKEARP